jgi:hypothetical protein
VSHKFISKQAVTKHGRFEILQLNRAGAMQSEVKKNHGVLAFLLSPVSIGLFYDAQNLSSRDNFCVTSANTQRTLTISFSLGNQLKTSQITRDASASNAKQLTTAFIHIYCQSH